MVGRWLRAILCAVLAFELVLGPGGLNVVSGWFSLPGIGVTAAQEDDDEDDEADEGPDAPDTFEEAPIVACAAGVRLTATLYEADGSLDEEEAHGGKVWSGGATLSGTTYSVDGKKVLTVNAKLVRGEPAPGQTCEGTLKQLAGPTITPVTLATSGGTTIDASFRYCFEAADGTCGENTVSGTFGPFSVNTKSSPSTTGTTPTSTPQTSDEPPPTAPASPTIVDDAAERVFGVGTTAEELPPNDLLALGTLLAAKTDPKYAGPPASIEAPDPQAGSGTQLIKPDSVSVNFGGCTVALNHESSGKGVIATPAYAQECPAVRQADFTGARPEVLIAYRERLLNLYTTADVLVFVENVKSDYANSVNSGQDILTEIEAQLILESARKHYADIESGAVKPPPAPFEPPPGSEEAFKFNYIQFQEYDPTIVSVKISWEGAAGFTFEEGKATIPLSAVHGRTYKLSITYKDGKTRELDWVYDKEQRPASLADVLAQAFAQAKEKRDKEQQAKLRAFLDRIIALGFPVIKEQSTLEHVAFVGSGTCSRSVTQATGQAVIARLVGFVAPQAAAQSSDCQGFTKKSWKDFLTDPELKQLYVTNILPGTDGRYYYYENSQGQLTSSTIQNEQYRIIQEEFPWGKELSAIVLAKDPTRSSRGQTGLSFAEAWGSWGKQKDGVRALVTEAKIKSTELDKECQIWVRNSPFDYQRKTMLFKSIPQRTWGGRPFPDCFDFGNYLSGQQYYENSVKGTSTVVRTDIPFPEKYQLFEPRFVEARQKENEQDYEKAKDLLVNRLVEIGEKNGMKMAVLPPDTPGGLPRVVVVVPESPIEKALEAYEYHKSEGLDLESHLDKIDEISVKPGNGGIAVKPGGGGIATLPPTDLPIAVKPGGGGIARGLVTPALAQDESAADESLIFVPSNYATVDVTGGPLGLLLTDPSGRAVGYNPLTGQTVRQIEGANYTGAGSAQNNLHVPGLLRGQYQLSLVGLGDGEYSGTVTLAINDQVVTKSLKGSIKKGETVNEPFGVSFDGETVSPFDVLAAVQGIDRSWNLYLILASLIGVGIIGWIWHRKRSDLGLRSVS